MRSLKLKLSAVCMLILLVGASPVALGDWEPNDGHKMHFPQLPDVDGWDVWASGPIILGDDWKCSETGYVEDIHFWGSCKGDEVGTVGHIQWIRLAIYDNDISGDYSKPGVERWSKEIEDLDPGPPPAEPPGMEGWFDPNSDANIPDDHNHFYIYNVNNITNPFLQYEGQIYWLVIQVVPQDCPLGWGWKTADVDSYPDPNTGKHYEDDAVWAINDGDPNWFELRDPLTDKSLDLAFVINGRKIPTVSQWGLIILALLLLTAGAIVIVRRRQRVTA